MNLDQPVARKARNGTAKADRGRTVGGFSSLDFRGHNVESLALNVIGQNWSGEKVRIFLEGWALARVASSCHGALDMLSKVACCHSKESLSLTMDGL